MNNAANEARIENLTNKAFAAMKRGDVVTWATLCGERDAIRGDRPSNTYRGQMDAAYRAAYRKHVAKKSTTEIVDDLAAAGFFSA